MQDFCINNAFLHFHNLRKYFLPPTISRRLAKKKKNYILIPVNTVCLLNDCDYTKMI